MSFFSVFNLDFGEPSPLEAISGAATYGSSFERRLRWNLDRACHLNFCFGIHVPLRSVHVWWLIVRLVCALAYGNLSHDILVWAHEGGSDTVHHTTLEFPMHPPTVAEFPWASGL